MWDFTKCIWGLILSYPSQYFNVMFMPGLRILELKLKPPFKNKVIKNLNHVCQRWYILTQVIGDLTKIKAITFLMACS